MARQATGVPAGQTRLTTPPVDRQRAGVTAFAVPRYLAETARRDESVREWIAGLPAIVADLAGRWSCRVGEPFQPGGQCSSTARVPDTARPAPGVKVGVPVPWRRRAGRGGRAAGLGRERARPPDAVGETAAGVRAADGAVPSRHPSLGHSRPERRSGRRRALRRLSAQPHAATRFARSRRCAPRGPRSSRRRTPPPTPRTGSIRLAGRDRVVPRTAADRGHPGAAVHRPARRQHPCRAARPVAGHRSQAVRRRPRLRRPAAHAQLRRPAGRRPGRAGRADGRLAGSRPAGSGCGCSPGACRSRSARRSCATWPAGSRPCSPPRPRSPGRAAWAGQAGGVLRAATRRGTSAHRPPVGLVLGAVPPGQGGLLVPETERDEGGGDDGRVAQQHRAAQQQGLADDASPAPPGTWGCARTV